MSETEGEVEDVGSDNPNPIGRSREDHAADQLKAGNRRANVAALILQRVPIRQISIQLNISQRTVRRDKAKMMARWSELAGERIDLQIGRELAALDQDEVSIRLLMKNETSGAVKLKFYDRIAAIGDSRRRLLGLDAAVKVGVRFEGSLRSDVVVRDGEFFKAALANPETRSQLLADFRKDAGMSDRAPSVVAALAAETPPKTTAPPIATSNGNGKPRP